MVEKQLKEILDSWLPHMHADTRVEKKVHPAMDSFSVYRRRWLASMFFIREVARKEILFSGAVGAHPSPGPLPGLSHGKQLHFPTAHFGHLKEDGGTQGGFLLFLSKSFMLSTVRFPMTHIQGNKIWLFSPSPPENNLDP